MINLKENKFVILIYNKLNGYKSKIKGSNNCVKYNKSVLKKTQISINGNNCRVSIGNNSRIINSRIFILGENQKVNIGYNCKIKNSTLWIEDEKCTINIGDNTTIEGAHIAVTEPESQISLGEDCMLSGNIDIRNGDSHSIIDIASNERINYAEDIIIGNHVWIGNNVQILKGVRIGEDSIIGTRTVVTKDIKPNTIVVGTPAKVVREGVTWNRERIYKTKE